MHGGNLRSRTRDGIHLLREIGKLAVARPEVQDGGDFRQLQFPVAQRRTFTPRQSGEDGYGRAFAQGRRGAHRVLGRDRFRPLLGRRGEVRFPLRQLAAVERLALRHELHLRHGPRQQGILLHRIEHVLRLLLVPRRQEQSAERPGHDGAGGLLLVPARQRHVRRDRFADPQRLPHDALRRQDERPPRPDELVRQGRHLAARQVPLPRRRPARPLVRVRGFEGFVRQVSRQLRHVAARVRQAQGRSRPFRRRTQLHPLQASARRFRQQRWNSLHGRGADRGIELFCDNHDGHFKLRQRERDKILRLHGCLGRVLRRRVDRGAAGFAEGHRILGQVPESELQAIRLV